MNVRFQHIVFFGLFLFSMITGLNAQSYNYHIDLVSVKSDKISVELVCPSIESDTIRYQFPSVIPGNHYWANYGRFIEKFQAFDGSGNSLPVVKDGLNDFIISDARRLKRVSYKVNDTADSKEKEKVMGWAATNFQKNEVFVINPGGVFGKFKNMANLPVQVSFSIPSGFYGSTSLELVGAEANELHYAAKDYHQLIDCPILFAQPDTASFMVGDTKIEIACYNEAGDAVADYIAKYIEPDLEAIYRFAGNELPVDKYTYLFFFQDFTNAEKMIYHGKVTPLKMLIKIILRHGRPKVGALEHSNSSYNNYLYFGKLSSIPGLLDGSVVHEFMHIYTPLNLHSELIQNFNYSTPVMSKHLWLYEGVTEYLTKLIKLRGGLIDFNEFITYEMRPKIVRSFNYPEDMTFTEMSEKIFTNPYRQQFMQVYERGAVLAMLLDIEIISLTNGEKDLKRVVFDLSERYGQYTAFDEDQFITEFVDEVHPDLLHFFERYVSGSEPLEIEGGLAKVGIDYTFKEATRVPITILENGHGVLDVIEAFGYYTINKAGSDSPFKAKDKIRSSDMTTNCYKPYLRDNGEFIAESETVKLPVYRNKTWIEIDLTPEFKDGTYYCKMKLADEPTESQKILFNRWIGK